MIKYVIGAGLLAMVMLVSGIEGTATATTVTACKVSARHCDYRCRLMLSAYQQRRCLSTCRTSQAKCLQQAYKDIELGKTPAEGGGTSTSPPPMTHEEKKAAEQGRAKPPASNPGGTPLQPCASWQVRYANGTCGCPSGMRGAQCDEIIIH